MQEQLNQIFGYLHGMWRYRWSALLISWIAALVGWVAVFAMPDQYQAKAVIYLDTSSIMKPLLKGLAVETDDSEELNVINRILLGRENLLSVIRETDMDLQVNSPLAREKLVQSLAESIVLKGGGGQKKWEKKSNIYEISYQSNSAQRVYQVVSVLLNTMIEKMLNSSRTDTVMAQKFLSSQITAYEKRLVSAEQHLARFKKQNVGMMPDEKGGYYTRLQSAQDNVDAIRSELRLAQQRRLELIKQLKGEMPLLESRIYGQVSDSKLQKYKEQLDLLRSKYTDQHPDVQTLLAVIETYEETENDSVQVSAPSESGGTSEFNPVYQDLKLEISKASVEVETMKLRLSDQQQRVEKLTGLIDAIPEVEAKLSELNRDYEISRQRYLELVERRESARLAELASQSSSEIKVRVIEPPIVPAFPTGPNRPLLLFGVLIGALGVGLGWCILRYLLKPTITNEKQLRDEIELPIFGAVSLFVTPQHKRKRAFQLGVFMSFILILVTVFGGLAWKQETGTELVRNFMINNSPEKLIKVITGTMGVGT